MEIILKRKCGHKFFVFNDGDVSREVCVDGWINSSVCPSFCHPSLQVGWEPLSTTGSLCLLESSKSYTVVCPTCFGFVSLKGAFRKVGSFHTNLLLDKSGLRQYLYNYIII